MTLPLCAKSWYLVVCWSIQRPITSTRTGMGGGLLRIATMNRATSRSLMNGVDNQRLKAIRSLLALLAIAASSDHSCTVSVTMSSSRRKHVSQHEVKGEGGSYIVIASPEPQVAQQKLRFQPRRRPGKRDPWPTAAVQICWQCG
jgi:hypothetical protein